MSECNVECAAMDRIATSMNTLTGDTHRVDLEIKALQGDVTRLVEDMYNGGKDGLKTQFIRFAAAYQSREEERDKTLARHYNRTMIAVSVLSVVVAILAILAGVHSFKTGKFSFPPITQSTSQQYTAHATQLPANAIEEEVTAWRDLPK